MSGGPAGEPFEPIMRVLREAVDRALLDQERSKLEMGRLPFYRPPSVDVRGTEPHVDEMPDETTDLKIKLSEAMGEARLAAALGDVRTGFARLEGKLDSLDRSTSGVKTTIIGTGIAVVAIIIAVLTYGQAWFGIGVSTRDIVRSTVAEMHVPAPPVKP